MSDQNRNANHRVGGWRRRRLRRIEPSADFARFLLGELDSSEYARLLMRPRRTRGIGIRPRPKGPIARARESAVVDGDRIRPIVVTKTGRVSPEYMRFLREEISSLEYAEAVTGCARLEGLYRAPAARFAFPPRPGLADAVLDALRLFCTVGGLAIALLVLLPFLAPLGARLAASAMQWAWTLSLVGAFLLAVTVRSEAASLILGTAHSIQRFVISHQRASAR